MKERVIFLDWLRIIACFMVILTHSNEPVYLGGQGTAISCASDAFWSTFFITLCRSCVPLFVLASSYLLFPVEGSTWPFLKKRLIRVGVPALIWLCVYAIVGAVQNPSPNPCAALGGNFGALLFNFIPAAGHLWFCYMIIGLYLLMPLISPWAKNVSKKELSWWLLLWLFTTLVPALRQAGIALNGTWAMWGEANWNEFGILYYVSGFFGYLLLGLWLRKFAPEMTWKRTLCIALPLFAGGFAMGAAWFYVRMPKCFPVDEALSTAVNMETLLRYCSLPVVMMTVGLFLCIRKIHCSGAFYRSVILPVSQASYGIYLLHMLVLIPTYGFFRNFFGPDGTPQSVLCTAASTFIVSTAISLILHRIPKIGKYLA